MTITLDIQSQHYKRSVSRTCIEIGVCLKWVIVTVSGLLLHVVSIRKLGSKRLFIHGYNNWNAA